MKKLILTAIFAALFFGITFVVRAQSIEKFAPPPDKKLDTGLGVGLDYGGIGGRVTYLPDKHVGIFGSLGYALIGTGYNVGAKYRFNPDNRFCIATGAMYGYNRVIKVDHASQYNKIYYGCSVFAGCEIRSRRNPANYFNVEFVVPFRSQQFKDDINNLRQIGVTFKNNIPFALSAGFHFGL